MPSGLRLSIASLLISVVTVTLATAVLPPRVRLGSHSFTCETFLHRERFDPIASALCDRAAAYRLRATVAIAALLAVLSFGPMVLDRRELSQRRLLHLLWGGVVVVVAFTAIALLAVVGARPETIFFDL